MSLNSKSILVTGGTGSFGRRFIDTVLREHDPKRVIVFSRDELKQHEMRTALPDTGDSPMRYFLGDVRDKDRLARAFSGVDVVVHAAALKQVPACEYNPFEAVLTNVVGSKNVLDAAIDLGVPKVIALSTDKAVNPVNLYGATKLCSEKLVVQGNAYAGGKGSVFSCARYGNVFGSRGSVVPIFLEQAKSGLVTVTDERMTRFWITLDQGVEFVLRCIEIMRGGEIFVPKIPSMRILDMATALAPGARIQTIGIRSGEKLHEVLLSDDEARHSIDIEGMYIVEPAHPWYAGDPWPDGRPLPVDFRYASDTNDVWLTAEDLKRLIA